MKIKPIFEPNFKSLLFRKNQQIELLHTGERATVLSQIDAQTVEVKLHRNNNIMPIKISSIRLNTNEIDKTQSNKQSYDTFKEEISLILIPELNKDRIELSYQLYFYNGVNSLWLIEISMKAKDNVTWRHRLELLPNKIHYIEQFPTDRINSKPQIDISLIPKLTNGTGKARTTKLRLQAKNFIKYKIDLYDQRYCYKIRLTELEQEKRKKDTAKLGIQKKAKHFNNEKDYQAPTLFFERECDLHIEKIKTDYSTYSNSEIIRIQMQHFNEYMDKVILGNLDRVFIIHGVGKGVLKNKIHEELKKRDDISSYINEYHPNYGWGATEITLK